YTWQLQPTEAGTLAQDSLTATITWNTGYQGEVLISAASYNDCGESAYSEVKTTFVYTCVGVEEYAVNGFGLRVYPNPAKEWVTFETNSNKPATIFVYNHTGQLVEKLELNNLSTNWNVGNLPRGLYFYRAEQDGKTVVGKLVLSGE
ncbi:MAG: T9SS type A sorting domain-containing protein, partial [Bacteroidetes bacterium]|nr:T9SS type A sorting domain-containing protein [Bacteroidota bacterium]